MSGFLPKEVQQGLDEARMRDLKRRARQQVHAGNQVYPILRSWPGGFALDAAEVTQLRGLVDIYEGQRHLAQSLIVASAVEDGQLICTTKLSTAALDRPPLDYVRDETAPVGYLPRH